MIAMHDLWKHIPLSVDPSYSSEPLTTTTKLDYLSKFTHIKTQA